MTRHTWTICSVCLSAHTGQLPLSFIPYRRLQLDDVTLAKRLLMITPKEAIQWKAWLWWRFWQERNIGYKNCLHCLVIAWVFRVNTRFLLPLLFSLYAPVFNCKLIYFTFSQRFEILYIIHVTSTFKWDALKKSIHQLWIRAKETFINAQFKEKPPCSVLSTNKRKWL